MCSQTTALEGTGGRSDAQSTLELSNTLRSFGHGNEKDRSEVVLALEEQLVSDDEKRHTLARRLLTELGGTNAMKTLRLQRRSDNADKYMEVSRTRVFIRPHTVAVASHRTLLF